MNVRVTLALFLVVLLGVAGLLIYSLRQDDLDRDAFLLADLAGLKFDGITALEIARTQPTEEKLVMVRTGKDRWEFRDQHAGRVDISAVNRIAEPLLKLKPVAAPEVTDDVNKHGLGPEAVRITLRGDNQRSATLLVGDTTLGGEQAITFVATGGRPDRPLAVRRSELAGLFREGAKDGPAWQHLRWISDFRLRRFFAADMLDAVTQAKALKITFGGHELALSRQGSEWQFDIPQHYGLVDIAGAPDPTPETITGLRGLMVTLSTMSAMAADDFIEQPEPLENYGLNPDNPDLMRIELVPDQGPAEVLLIGKQVPDAAPVKYYAQVPGERCVVRVLGDRLTALRNTVANPRPLQDRTLIRDLDAPRIDAIDIAAGGTQISLRQMTVDSVKRWLIAGTGDPLFAGSTVQTLISEICKPRSATEVCAQTDEAMFAADQVRSEIRIWMDAIKTDPAAKMPGLPKLPVIEAPPTVTLILGKSDGETAYLRRIRSDGSRTDFKIPEPLAALLTKPRYDYFDLKFKEFATNQARRLRFNRGTELFELERSASEPDFPTGKWTFVSPDALKGQVADTDLIGGNQLGAGLLGTLATLTAASVVTESTPDEQTIRTMGLDPAAPRLKVVVTLDSASEPERGFEFGAETADQAYVYFRPQGSSIIYLVPRVAVDLFLTGDLRDRTPYRFDTKSVQRIRLKGWKDKPGVQELVLVRRGDTWTAESPEAFPVNPQSVALLLNHFRAPKPNAVVGPQSPEHGLASDPEANNPLEVTFEADQGPIVRLIVGNETDEGAYYFVWNSITSEVIKLPTAIFRQFKQGPDFFKK